MPATSSYLNRPLHSKSPPKAYCMTPEMVKDMCGLADRLDTYALRCNGSYPDSYLSREQLQSEAATLRTLIAKSYPDEFRAHEAELHEAQRSANRYETAMTDAVVGPLTGAKQFTGSEGDGAPEANVIAEEDALEEERIGGAFGHGA